MPQRRQFLAAKGLHRAQMLQRPSRMSRIGENVRLLVDIQRPGVYALQLFPRQAAYPLHDRVRSGALPRLLQQRIVRASIRSHARSDLVPHVFERTHDGLAAGRREVYLGLPSERQRRGKRAAVRAPGPSQPAEAKENQAVVTGGLRLRAGALELPEISPQLFPARLT